MKIDMTKFESTEEAMKTLDKRDEKIQITNNFCKNTRHLVHEIEKNRKNR